MAEYYLISQLPSLDGIGDETPLPITEERFLEICRTLLGKKALEEIETLTISPSRYYQDSSSSLLKSWYEGERNLRNTLAKARADRMRKPYNTENASSSELIKVVNTALDMENPLKAEKYLNSYRLELLESIRPTDTFSEEYLYYYGIKLKLISYIRQFDTKKGETAYKNIYSSILDGANLEAI